jgi:hypothetical protein
VISELGHNNGKLYWFLKKKFVLSSAKPSAVSAKALYYLAASKDVQHVSGKFFNLTAEEKPAPHARDERSVEPIWNKSLELCGPGSSYRQDS